MRWPGFPSAPGVVEMVSGGLRLPEAGILRRVRESACLDGGAVSATRDPTRRIVAAWRGEPGEVAAWAGSRGINRLADVIRAELEDLQCGGWRPFIVSAIASHRGGTADGQLKLLADHSITETVLPVPVQATMGTVVIGETRGIPAHVDRNVASANHSSCQLYATRSTACLSHGSPAAGTTFSYSQGAAACGHSNI